jgi:type IVB pilus formation R64 PilN family outer membrane protein
VKVKIMMSPLLAIVLAVGLAGCEVKRVNESMSDVEASTAKADSLARSLRNRTGAQSSVHFTDDQWVNTTPISIKRGLPPTRDCEVGYNDTKSLQQFAQWLSGLCSKIPVQVMPDALDHGASYLQNRSALPGATASAPAADGSISDLFPDAGAGKGASMPSVSTYQPSTMYQGPMSVSTKYQGSLSGLLDTATGGLGLSWRYDSAAGVIKVYYLESRLFPVYAFNKGNAFKSEVRSGMSSTAGTSSGGSGQGTSSGGTSGESGSSQTTQVTMVSSLLDDIERNVRSMLSLGKMSFSRTTGLISITDRPDVLDRVQAYLDEENNRITKNILVNVEVISVRLTDTSQYGIDWSLVYKSVSGDWGFGLTNSFQGVGTGAVSSSISILDTSSSPWAGSKAIIKALSQQGRISSYRAPSVTTLNLQAAPIQIGKVKGYLQSSQISQSANVGTTSSLIPGSITSGFNMSLVPMVMPSDQLLMQLMINMIGDPLLEEISAGGSKIQNPSYDTQILNQAVKLRSGQTLVLSGFDQSTVNASKSGTFSPSNFLFGGGGLSEKSRDVLVLMITPIILE